MNLGNSTIPTRLRNDQIRALSLNVYSQCRRHLVHQNAAKTLTGFGPAAAADIFLKKKDVSVNGMGGLQNMLFQVSVI